MVRLTVVFVLAFLAASHAYAAERGSVPAAQQPVVKQMLGIDTIELDAAIYPNFKDIQDQFRLDPLCFPECKSGPLGDCVFETLAGKPITTLTPSKTKKPKKSVAMIDDTEIFNPALIDELGPQATDLKIKITGADIPQAYRKTAKILVNWTLRVEGTCPTWEIGKICHFWGGTVTFECPAGIVETYLNADYKYKDSAGNDISGKLERLGGEFQLNVPKSSSIDSQVDPTLVGTYIITADNFPDRQIPTELTLTVYWQNFTSFQVRSLDKFRNMVVNIIPYSKKDR